MKFNELLSAETLDNVSMRSTRLAQQHGNLISAIFERDLSWHVPERLSPETLEQMSKAESQKAYEQYINERANGKRNDTICTGLGYTALIVNAAPHLEDYIIKTFQISQDPASNTPKLYELDPIDGIHSPLLALQVKSGLYMESPNVKRQLDFFMAEVPLESTELFTGPKLNLADNCIAKIVGDSGELWINPNKLASVALFQAEAHAF